MSRLYASINSDARKTQATSRGHKSISAHVRGWDNGVEVEARADNGGPSDTFDIYMTSGSHPTKVRVFLGTVKDGKFEPAQGA